MSDAREEPARGHRTSARDESETVLASSAAAAARRTVAHFQGRDAAEPEGPPDGIELWGRRIGRALSLAACAALGIYLYLTYLR